MVLRVWKLSIIVMCAVVVIASGVSAATISLRPNATWMERAAAGDLQRVIFASTGEHLAIESAKASGSQVIAVGYSPAGADLSRKTLGDQGFVLKTVTSGGRTVLTAAGATPVATTYAVYALAEEYGAGFYLGGDALPQKKQSFHIPNLDIVKKPALAIRGVLPWYNFFDSPTAWNLEDYRSFIDQLAKSRNNFIGFHSYDYEPFCAYKDKSGKLAAGRPLVSTSQSTWGTSPMKTADFLSGTAKYFNEEYFGSDCSVGYKTPDEGVANARKLLGEALSYAKARGLKTCVGFEVSGDPALAESLDDLEMRLTALVGTYPMLDYIWIWEPEAAALRGTDVRATRSNYGAYYRRFSKAFSNIKEPQRRSEAVRMAIYALAAHRILQREAPHVKMVLSGWGGDKHLHFTDFYPGLDKVLPKDIIFSALDNIVITDTVSSAYTKLSKDREFWPIPWFEFDGDQWFPQPNTRQFAGAANDALKKGAKGLLGIHWRTRDVEESHAFVSEFAWNPKLTYEEFYKDYARRAFGTEQAAGLLMDLQSFGYRWIGGRGQMECGGFAWDSGQMDTMDKLSAVFDKYPNLPESERLRDLKLTRDWVENYSRAADVLCTYGLPNLPSYAQAQHDTKPRPEDIVKTADYYDQADLFFGMAIASYARRVSNRGELGVLATINAKAGASLLGIADAIEKVMDIKVRPGKLVDSGLPAVNSILRSDTAFAGEPFRISALVHGASASASAEVVYRAPGKEWSRAKLKFANSGRLEGAIPASAASGDLLEYYIKVSDSNIAAQWPSGGVPACVSVVPKPAEAFAQPKPLAKANGAVGRKIACTPGANLLQLEWKDEPSVRVFRVMRQSVGAGKWQEVGKTRDTWFEDRGVRCGSRYRYQVMDTASGRMVAESAAVIVLDPPAPPAPVVEVSPGQGRVRLRWPGDSVEAVGYRVYRSENPDGPYTMLDKVQPVLSKGGIWACSCPAEPDQVYFYKVSGFSKPGKFGPMSNHMLAAALSSNAEPVLTLAFNGNDPDVKADCVVEDGLSAAKLGDGKQVELLQIDQCNLVDEISIEFWVKLTKPGVMPVIVCRGYWGQDGYFVQYLSGAIRFYLAGVGTLDAGSLPVGQWTHVAATYDGDKMIVYRDGKPVGSLAASGPIRSSNRSLYIGRYEDPSSDYIVNGYVGDVRIFPYALSAADVKTSYEMTASRIKMQSKK